MKVTTSKGWHGEVDRHIDVTTIDVGPEESLVVEPGPRMRAFVVMIPDMETVSTRD